MQLGKERKQVIELLWKDRHGLSLSQIARKLSKDVGNLHRTMRKLMVHNLVEKIPSKPAIYKLNLQSKYELTFVYVTCPKCSWRYKAGLQQSTKVCENPDCKRPNGFPTRFYITDKRIDTVERLDRE